ncbi:MAG: trypsin-like peptidase domain-containing protein [Planctomycetia bacterium]|nr:trypsin-like peptidase domain-containing protein [Planctomycetia bacterium]
MKHKVFGAALVLVMLIGGAVAARADKENLDVALSLQKTIQGLAERVGPTVVNIEITRTSTRGPQFHWRMPQPERLPPELREFLKKFGEQNPLEKQPEMREFEFKANGSGVIISADGFILTNEHVASGAKKISITLANKDKYDAVVVGRDTRRDLAVHKNKAKGLHLNAAKLGSSEPITRGTFVVAMGSPFGFGRDGQASISFGIVSGTGRFVPSLGRVLDRYYGNLIQTDAAINPGNSGGPLCNLKGEVIGINTAISSLTGASQGVGFAIPITPETQRIIKRLMKGEKIEYGFLGVEIRSPTRQESKVARVKPHTGAFVANVLPGKPADKAGLLPGDVILNIDGKDIGSPDELIRIIGAMPVGSKTKLTYVRSGKKRTVEVSIARRELLAAHLRPREGPAHVVKLWRGISVRDITDEDRGKKDFDKKAKGVQVVAVVKGSPGEEAGIKTGTVIDQVSDKKVQNLEEFNAAIKKVSGDCFVHIFGNDVKTVKAEEKKED